MTFYQEPKATTATTITPKVVTKIKEDDTYGPSFGALVVRMVNGKETEFWFNCSFPELRNQFRSGKPTAIEYYKTDAGNLKIKYAEASGWTPPVEVLQAQGNGNSSNSTYEDTPAKRKSIEKQTIYNGFMAAAAAGVFVIDNVDALEELAVKFVNATWSKCFNDTAVLENATAAAAQVLGAKPEFEPDEDLGKHEPVGDEDYDPDAEDDIPF